MTLDHIAFGASTAAWDAGDHAAARDTLAISARRPADAEADFFICPDSTAHLALEVPGTDLALPGLHIAEIVADGAAREGRRRVGVLGTTYVMDSPLYARALGARGIAAVLPPPENRGTVHRIIFDELVNGEFTAASRRRYRRVVEDLAARGCDAVALACTEIPLLLTPDVSPLPTLDSTRLLARAAFDTATGLRPLPTWRGGAVGAWGGRPRAGRGGRGGADGSRPWAATAPSARGCHAPPGASAGSAAASAAASFTAASAGSVASACSAPRSAAPGMAAV
ncbi:aspartate/glutamate racemase family protein [Streptomyces pinistramenti]|uniref:aspartate/glutamate racemase family protein n=1 Tax=Streptomyces pinistramenti TaxID=2884812 RepID=UPI0027E47064|nr:amino acid racemase [Streptomyces pinistramenti]